MESQGECTVEYQAKLVSASPSEVWVVAAEGCNSWATALVLGKVEQVAGFEILVEGSMEEQALAPWDT